MGGWEPVKGFKGEFAKGHSYCCEGGVYLMGFSVGGKRTRYGPSLL